MKLTKLQLQAFLTERPAISLRKLSLESGLHENAINQLFNGCNRNLTKSMSDKLIIILPKYGFEK